MPTILRLRATLFALLLAALAQAAHAAEQPKVLMDEWRALYISGQKAGYEHTLTREMSDPKGVFYLTSDHSEVAVSRAGVPLKLTTDSLVREDAEGKVVSFRYQSPLGGSSEGTLQGDKFVLESKGLTGTSARVTAPPSGLGPWAAELLARKKGYEPGTTYDASVFYPESPAKPVQVSVAVGAVEKVRVFDVDKWLHKRTVTYSLMPGIPSTEWVDGDGVVWLSRMPLTPDVQVETRKTTRELATAPAEPAELLTTSYVIPDLPIEDPRKLQGLQVLLRPVESGAEAPLPVQDERQKVQVMPQGVMVTIQLAPLPKGAYTLPYAGKEYADLLKPNKWLESDDPLMQKMAREAVGGSTDPVVAARRIELYVNRKIVAKGLGVGMATAAETARQLTGDCTEHSVLAAALARAAGMPSRVVGGLVYVDGLPGAAKGGFGYHMWTEVYVGEWLPIDATFGGYDATHIALVKSDMNSPDAAVDLASAIVQFLGRVEIHVMRQTH
jgi:transglutaminase-like putative cysteine protease